MTAAMQRWGREIFGSVRKQIAKLKVQLNEAKERAIHTGYNQEIRDLEDQLRDMYEKEEIMRRQRSRVDWLQAGDQNTRYFQNRASHRKRKNSVRALLREDGSRSSVDEEMRSMAADFYAKLFASEGSRKAERLLRNIDQLVSGEMNVALMAAVTDEEIERALFQMGPTKSPGPDGLPVMFYQRHWSLVKNDVCRAVRDFLSGEEILENFNQTIIVMIDPQSKLTRVTVPVPSYQSI